MQPARGPRRTGSHQIRPLDTAALKYLRATRIERAACGDGIEPRHGAIDLIELIAVLADVWNRCHQSRCIGMGRTIDDLVDRADFGDAPGVHHGYTVAGFGDHAHV